MQPHDPQQFLVELNLLPAIFVWRAVDRYSVGSLLIRYEEVRFTSMMACTVKDVKQCYAML